MLTRSPAKGGSLTTISPNLHSKLLAAAIGRACEFYGDFLGLSTEVDVPGMVDGYQRSYAAALNLGLFAEGGIREKDHLNLWCLGKRLCPETYVESGVFIGSSLHAFVSSETIDRVVAIDPDLSKLKVSTDAVREAKLIDGADFSEIEFQLGDGQSLVYFDDHINTANRILQAAEKGFRYLLFDDSTGLEGVCQRLYPATPTIPMVMHCELFSPGDELAWSFQKPIEPSLASLAKGLVQTLLNPAGERVTMTATQELIDLCQAARDCVNQCEKIPDLGEFIPQSRPNRTVDTSKYLIELK
ncbi:MAG: hypothetical protein AAGD11_19130 [Planctomycetota bacterium]